MENTSTSRFIPTGRSYPDVEAVIASYGEGQPFTELEALDIFDKVRRQADAKMPFVQGYRVVDAWMVGDREQGQVWARFESPNI